MHFTIAAAGALALSVLASSLSSAQSLGEVARREAERRKSVKTSGKIYTNDSLRTEPTLSGAPAGAPPASQPAQAAVPPSPSGVPPGAGAAPGQPGTPAPPDPPKTEADWKERLAAERDGLSRAQTFAEALQSRINVLSADFAARSDPAQRNVISANRQKALAELDRVKQEIQQHTKGIATIQDEARRAGVPAGWVR